jgi:glycosyltransferase involved in cell wall biosynthesis
MKDPTFVSVVLRLTGFDNTAQETIHLVDDFISERFAAYEMILVNDASTDIPDSVTESLVRTQGVVVILEMAYPQGTETAMLAGLDRAMGDFVFEIDSTTVDYPIAILDTLYKTARAGNDIVAAVPKNLPLGTRFFYWICNKLSSITPPLCFERIRISSRRAVDAMLRQPERVRYRQVLYRYTGYKYADTSYRSDDKSVLRPSGRLAFGVDIFWSFNDDVGARLARVFAVVFIITSIIALVGTLARTGADPWWVLLAVGALFGFAGIFVIFTVTTEFLALILGEVRNRPLYTLDRTLTRTILRSSPLSELDAPDQPLARAEREHALHMTKLAVSAAERPVQSAAPNGRQEDAPDSPDQPGT